MARYRPVDNYYLVQKIKAKSVHLKSFWRNNVEISRDSSSIVRFLGQAKKVKKQCTKVPFDNFLYFCVVDLVDNFCQRNTCTDFCLDFSKRNNCKKVNFDKMLSYDNSTWVLNPNS